MITAAFAYERWGLLVTHYTGVLLLLAGSMAMWAFTRFPIAYSRQLLVASSAIMGQV